MSENETPALDPAEFDLDSWLVGGTAHRPTRSVTVYRDLNLNAELEAATARLDALESVTDKEGNVEEELGGDPERAQLEDKIAALVERMRSTTATVTVFGLTSAEEQAIDAKPGTQEFTFEVLAQAGALQGHKLTTEQWARLNETLGHGQWTRVLNAYQAAQRQVPDVTAPFSRKSSRKVTGD